MQTWFECRVKSLQIDSNGFERTVNVPYLIDAVSYTDAETRINEVMPKMVKGDFRVTSIKQSNITEILPSGDGQWWYKAKISLVTIDEAAGREKKVSQYILVMADDIMQALTRLDEGLKYMLVPYTVDSIGITTIADVFPYDLAEGAAKMEESEVDKMAELGFSQNGLYKMQEESEE